MKRLTWVALSAVSGLIGPHCLAEADPEHALKFGAFVDTYYAFDFNRPAGFDRIFVNSTNQPPVAYSTQPARHNEFNVNLAFIEATLEEERTRGRLALQAGTSVQVNYAQEPTIGSTSGPVLTRHLQEAVAGYRLAPDLWIDGGIFFSHLGFESFISRDNWNYTRSLAADNSPYYQTGMRATYRFSSRFSGQLHLINGWQTISEANPQKAVGTQLAYDLGESVRLSYNTFIGYEAGSRIFNDFVVTLSLSDRLQFAGIVDIGIQKPAAGGRSNHWYTGTFLTRYQITENLALAGRVERFLDPKSVIVATRDGRGSNISGASIGADLSLSARLLWRSELRTFSASSALFQQGVTLSNHDSFGVTSLSLTL